ncbi:MAG: hypothetical protein LT070_00125 [Solirubrobacteraceae bacterium]|nr:hypothetical protein [Solirubrobacteraceae bacterium]
MGLARTEGGLAARRRRTGIAAIAVLACSWALVMQSLGWAQTSYMAFVKALADGTASIDAYHWETRDKSWIDGHFFSVKAPGMPMLLLPWYEAIRVAGGERLAREAADRARSSGAREWTYRGLNVASYGYESARAARVKRALEVQAPLVWALGLLGTVLPAAGLLLMVRAAAERLRAGLGTATAMALGGGTLVLPFATQLFGHVLAALLGFAAFAVLLRERDGPSRLPMVALAGLLAGLAVVVEYPLAIAGGIVGLYGVLRADAVRGSVRALLRRTGAYAAGVAVGVLPLAAYNLWAFGSLTTMSYANAVDRQGVTGHQTLGLNDGGFFGIGAPRPRVALELLLAPRGLLALTPVVVLAAAGVWLLARRGRRAEALTIAAVASAFLVYDSGYWLPFGGGSPGPRFLVPALPFLALGLVESWRRWPVTTLALTTCGTVVMLVGTLTYPLIGTGSLWQWWSRLRSGEMQHTVLAILGLGNGLAPALLVVLGVAGAGVLAARATPRAALAGRDARLALWAVGAWVLVALVLAPVVGERRILGAGAALRGHVNHGGLPRQIVALAAGAALIALAIAWWSSRRRARRSVAESVDDERSAPLTANA